MIASKKVSYIFRPVAINRLHFVKDRLQGYGQHWMYHWYPRHDHAYARENSLNRRTLGRIFSNLHYLAEHAPYPVRKKWKPAYTRFYKHHLGVRLFAYRVIRAHDWM